MAGTCIEKLPHSCGSSDGLQVFQDDDDNITGYCFVCDTFVPDPVEGEDPAEYKKKAKLIKKTPEEVQEELDSISRLKTFDVPSRKLRAEILEYYGVKVGLSEVDGKTPRIMYFPGTRKGQVVRYKCKVLGEKRMWSVGQGKDIDLFGWEQAKASGAKRLIICEGEEDAIALKRILQIHTPHQYKENIPAVVSINNGAGGAVAEIDKSIRDIRKHFKEVSLCFDQDEVGEKATEAVCKKYPEFSVINLPCKDANEGLVKGMGKAVHKAATFNADKPKNTRLIWGKDVHEDAKKPAVWGFSWPWKHVNEATKGIRLGETIYIGAGQKAGKSEQVNQLAAHFIKEHGWKVLMAKPEEANNKTYKMVAGKVAGKKFHDPSVEFDEASYEKAGEVLKDNLAMINLYQHVTWEVLKQDIRAASSEGVKAVFIDPITNLVNGLPVSDQNTKLQEIAQDAAALALDLNIVIFFFCHLRNPENGPPHERGGKVESHQFAGSRAMARSCNLMFGLEGNRDPDLPPEERNMRTLVLLEDREFGNTGRFQLYWNHNTTLFEEVV